MRGKYRILPNLCQHLSLLAIKNCDLYLSFAHHLMPFENVIGNHTLTLVGGDFQKEFQSTLPHRERSGHFLKAHPVFILNLVHKGL